MAHDARSASLALESERHQGLSDADAIGQACLLRFPLGISIIGGLLLSQLLTLSASPVIYLAPDRLNRRIEMAAPPAGTSGGNPIAGV